MATLASGGSVVVPRRFVVRDFSRSVVERRCTRKCESIHFGEVRGNKAAGRLIQKKGAESSRSESGAEVCRTLGR
jgi:hypothetical protein